MSSYSYSGSRSKDTNHFSIDTPDGDWTQYRCAACNYAKRVEIRPTDAPMSVRRICKRCESRQKLRADGGSGIISKERVEVLDLTTETGTEVSTAEALGALRSGEPVRTPITDPDVPGEPHIYLRSGDEVCHRCEPSRRIPADDFGKDAPFLRLLANQKLHRDETYCESCLSEVVDNE